MAGFPLEHIREKIRHSTVWINSSKVDFFSSAVPERATRYIVKLMINGDAIQSRATHFYKKKEDSTYVVFLKHLQVAPADHVEIPQNSYDIRQPLITLPGGTNFTGEAEMATGTSMAAAVVYWDDTF